MPINRTALTSLVETSSLGTVLMCLFTSGLSTAVIAFIAAALAIAVVVVVCLLAG